MHARTALSVFALALGLLAQPAFAADRTIGPLSNPEDLVATADGHWVFSSSMSFDPAVPGGFYAINAKTRAAQKVELAAAKGTAQCPDGFDPAKTKPHGLDRVGDTLYAVNHGGRESVEVFHIGKNANGPTLTWKDCLILPPDSVGNGVAARPDGSLYLSNNGASSAKVLKGEKVERTGNLLHWTGKAWEIVKDSTRPAWNGLALTLDGKHLYVAQTIDKQIYDFDLTGKTAPRVLEMSYMPDNLHWSADGKSIVVAGQDTTIEKEFACFGKNLPRCDLGFGFGRIDPKTLKPICMKTMAPTPEFDFATGAIAVGHEIWIGTAKGTAVFTTDTCAP
jgi:hypothetical protein